MKPKFGLIGINSKFFVFVKVVKDFGVLFQAVGVLLFCGLMASVLTELQARAFNSKRVGLVSMLEVNKQLVGKTE